MSVETEGAVEGTQHSGEGKRWGQVVVDEGPEILGWWAEVGGSGREISETVVIKRAWNPAKVVVI